VSKLLLVRDELWQFKGELEVIVACRFPVMHRSHTRRRVEGRIALYGMENLSVLFKALCGLGAFTVELTLPLGMRPHG
jgi:hypothetical protein